ACDNTRWPKNVPDPLMIPDLIDRVHGLDPAHQTAGGSAKVAVRWAIFVSIVHCGVAMFFVHSTVVGAAAATAPVPAGG
ncbi:MAG: hypothetical protein ACC628_10540, partial [Pirellulaceae bacterium]